MFSTSCWDVESRRVGYGFYYTDSNETISLVGIGSINIISKEDACVKALNNGLEWASMANLDLKTIFISGKEFLHLLKGTGETSHHHNDQVENLRQII